MNNNLPQNLLTIRNILGKNQTEMADLLDIGRAAYVTYESGKSVPNVLVVLQIADRIGFSVEELCSSVIPGTGATQSRMLDHQLKKSNKVS